MKLIGDSGKVYDYTKKDVRLGISSLVRKSRYNHGRTEHIILIDYDRMKMPEIKSDIYMLRRRFKLPTFYIFRTSKGRYSAMCFKRVNWTRYKKILFAANCCVNFRYYTIKKAKFGTLRIDPKPDKESSNLSLVGRVESHKKRVMRQEDEHIKKSVFKLIELSGGSLGKN